MSNGQDDWLFGLMLWGGVGLGAGLLVGFWALVDFLADRIRERRTR